MSLKEIVWVWVRGVGLFNPSPKKGTCMPSWQKQQLYVIPAQLELESVWAISESSQSSC